MRLDSQLRHGYRIQHQPIQAFLRLLQLTEELLTQFGQSQAAAGGVENGRSATQLVGAVAARQLDDAVLHFAIVIDQHHQQPTARERQEFELSERLRLGQRNRHHAGQTGDAGQQLTGIGHQRPRVITGTADVLTQFLRLKTAGRRQVCTEQRVDEEAVGPVGRHPAG